jgi:hypothetical protein
MRSSCAVSAGFFFHRMAIYTSGPFCQMDCSRNPISDFEVATWNGAPVLKSVSECGSDNVVSDREPATGMASRIEI